MKNHFIIPVNTPGRPVMESIWQTEGYPGFSGETIIPSGKAEIIFNFSDGNITTAMGNRSLELPSCFINGYNTEKITMQLPQWRFFFGVRLGAHTVKQLFGIPAGEFANAVTDLNLIDRSARVIWQRLREAADFNTRITLVREWLDSKAFKQTERDSGLIHFVGDTRNLHENPLTLSKSLSWSQRHISRKLNELTGMGCEEFILYKKYMNAVNLLHFTQQPLTSVGYESNFYDQAHFIKVFKRYSGYTPGQYRVMKSHMPGHIFI